MKKPALLVFLSLTACGVTPIDTPDLSDKAPPSESPTPTPQGNVRKPTSTTEFRAGDYKGTQYKSRQDGDESGQYDPPRNFGEDTGETDLKITKVSDTQLEVSYLRWYEKLLVDIHEDGTLTIPDQLAGSEFRWRGSAESFVIQGAKPGSGTWDAEGNLTLNWLSLFKVSSYSACPDENGSMNNTCYSYSYEYREQRITAKWTPTASTSK